MKINEFIERTNIEGIENLKDILTIRNYAPFADKYDLCSSVLAECNTIDEKTGIVTVDSVMRHVVFTITILSLYTNLEFSSDENSEINSIDEYDMLCQYKLLKPIINEFAEEYAECEQILNTMQNDLIANSNNMHHMAGNMAKQFLNVIEPLADILKDKIEAFDLDLSQDNIDKYIKLFEQMGTKQS